MEIEDQIKQAFSKETGFAQILPDYEEREEQTKMALAVYDALKNSHHLLVEAGTGVGKSLAYALPAALWTDANKKRVIISTYTKILQNQLIKKDLPILKSVLGDDLTVEVIYGQENYLCQRRLNFSLNYGLFDTREQALESDAIIEWSKSSSGILPEYPNPISLNTLERIGRKPDGCLFEKCQFYDRCFYFQAKRRWQQAQIIVVNHYLFFANVENNYYILPKFDAVIMDEAHRLEEVIANYFGIELSNLSILRLLSLIYNPRTSRGIISRIAIPRLKESELSALLNDCRDATNEFFSQISTYLKGDEFKKRIKEPLLIDNTLDQYLSDANSIISELVANEEDLDLASELASLARRLNETRNGISQFLSLEDKNSVYWIERSLPDRVSLHSALIDVSELFKTKVFEKVPSVIMTSATLTVNRDFSFVKHRLGADKSKILLLDSPFDYSKHALLYLAHGTPLPTDETKFYDACAQTIDEVLQLSQGRALILFTSYQAMREVYNRVKKGNYEFLMQGEEPIFKLLESFRNDVTSVLFATQSFWQGIDVPGEALSCLVITRLPFDVPDDPRLEGITENLKEKGSEPFYSFQLPSAVLRFRQGFGRLIRNTKDRGVVCVLDKR
ncbi:MAG: ATP-dependent DNA helicase, partial [bacterium]